MIYLLRAPAANCSSKQASTELAVAAKLSFTLVLSKQQGNLLREYDQFCLLELDLNHAPVAYLYHRVWLRATR